MKLFKFVNQPLVYVYSHLTETRYLNLTQASQASTKVIILKIEIPCLDSRISGQDKMYNISHHSCSARQQSVVKQMLLHSLHFPHPTEIIPVFCTLQRQFIPSCLVSWSACQNTVDCGCPLIYQLFQLVVWRF